MLGVVASVWAVVCKRMQQHTNNVGSCCVRVGIGVQTDPKTPNKVGPSIVGRIQRIRLWRPCVMRMRGPNNVGRAVQTDPTLLRYASAITEQKKCWELFVQEFERIQTLRNNSKKHQLHTTTCKRVSKRTQHVTFNKAGRCWSRMLRPFSRGLSVVQWNPTKPPPVNITTLFWVSFFESIVKKQARKGVWAQRFFSTIWQELLISAVGTFSSTYAETDSSILSDFAERT